MANNNHQQGGLADDFLEQILAIPSYVGNVDTSSNDGNLAGTPPPPPTSSMLLQLNNSGDVSGGGGGGGYHHHHHHNQQQHLQGNVFPLGLSLEQGKAGFLKPDHHHHHHQIGGLGSSGKRFRGEEISNNNSNSLIDGNASSSTTSGNNNDRGGGVHLTSLFPAFGHVQQQQSVRPATGASQSQVHQQPFHGQPTPGAVAPAPHPPAIRPRVRARRGQATDPHSIAERLRRERIAERMKALQELVPSSNKTDRAAMLDEIVDYVKFLRLQVKVLSMSRLGGAGAVAQLVAEAPLPSVEGEASDGGSNTQAWEKWSTDGTEHQVAKLMEEDVGAAMQYLQSKALCIMPISLATAIYHTHQTDNPAMIKPEPNAHQ